MQTEINFEEEIWRPVNSFETRFRISSYGRLLSIGGTFGGVKILPLSIDQTGYVCATLRSKPLKRRVRIHTLVAEHFLIKPDFYRPVVNHLDGNKLNNYVSNLEWTTYKGNSEHAIRIGLFDLKGSKSPNAKLKESDVLEMRSMYPDKTHKEIAKIYGMSRKQTGDIINRINWKHI